MGGVLALGLSRMPGGWVRWALLLAPLGLAATFVAPGLSGVHRWVAAGPISFKMAELLLATFVVAAASGRASFVVRLICTLAVLLLLIAQPDASQAVAVAGGAIAAILKSGAPSLRRALACVGIAVVAALALSRPDPLAPVPRVEGVLQLAAAYSHLLAAAAVVALGVSASAPLVLRSSAGAASAAAVGLSAYFALAALAPLLGAFPVPLMGLGVSPILGAWLGFGSLMSLAAAEGKGRPATSIS
ncbi:hypothetical protein BH09PSE2_BH09PSE2_24700 [soil metagenome]